MRRPTRRVVSEKADRLRSRLPVPLILSKKISFSASSSSVSVFAPASVANFGVGFDVLGAALDGPGDTLTARLTRAPGVRVVSISGDGGRLPRDPRLNTAAVSAAAVLAEFGGRGGRGARRVGIELSLEKGLPLSSGLGSSAASAAAGAYAAGLLLGVKDRLELLGAALKGEHAADGSWHGDNVFAALLGGFVLVPSSDPRGILAPVSLRIPPRVRIVVVSPGLELPTRRRAASCRGRFRWARTRRTPARSRASSSRSPREISPRRERASSRTGSWIRNGFRSFAEAAPRSTRSSTPGRTAPASRGPGRPSSASPRSPRTRRGSDAPRWPRGSASGVPARARVHRIDRRGTRLARTRA